MSKRTPDKQFAIPGLELPPELVKKPKTSDLVRISNLETRTAHLELELTLLRIFVEKGEKNNDYRRNTA